MYMAVVSLVPGELACRDRPKDAVVTDILWNAAGPEDGLEHVYSRTAAGRVEVTLFHRTRAAADAHAAALRICLHALTSSPSLRGWYLACC